MQSTQVLNPLPMHTPSLHRDLNLAGNFNQNDFRFPLVEPQEHNGTRVATVQQVEPLRNDQYRLHLSSQAGERCVVIKGDIRRQLYPSLGNLVFLNKTNVVPKVDDFADKPGRY